MYEKSSGQVTAEDDDKIDNKINTICEKLILMFEKLNNSRYFISILSCHAKMNDLDEALKKIIKFRCKLTVLNLK
jgi:transcription initiation factor IIE alpha subunit